MTAEPTERPRPPRTGAPRPASITGRPVTSMNERRAASRHRRHANRHANRSAAAEHAASRLRNDRWGWRRRIRRSPRKLAFYRAIVGVIGTFFICLGIITGPLPGPGGIPLVLLGLAIWASEFHWAHRIMVWFKARLKQYGTWTGKQKLLFWLVFAACCGLLIWTYLAVLGPPAWVPAFVQHAVTLLPGV